MSFSMVSNRHIHNVNTNDLERSLHWNRVQWRSRNSSPTRYYSTLRAIAGEVQDVAMHPIPPSLARHSTEQPVISEMSTHWSSVTLFHNLSLQMLRYSCMSPFMIFGINEKYSVVNQGVERALQNYSTSMCWVGRQLFPLQVVDNL